MRYWLGLCAVSLALNAGAASPPNDRSVQKVQFAKGQSSATVKGRIQGYRFVDYQFQAGAGQTLQIGLKGSNLANYFHLIPPGSVDSAMAMGEWTDNQFKGVLPDDGVYTVRVFLMRAVARRNEASDYQLSIGIEGHPLKPLSAQVDKRLPGTRFHASTSVACQPPEGPARQCDAMVVRRDHEGSATVEFRWEAGRQTVTRRVLLVKGQPVSSDVPQEMQFNTTDRGWQVRFQGGDHFDIPRELVFGG